MSKPGFIKISTSNEVCQVQITKSSGEKLDTKEIAINANMDQIYDTQKSS